MIQALYVGVGGFLGALLRYGIGELLARLGARRFPLATLTVNLLGSFAIGVLLTLAYDRQTLSEGQRLLLVTGMLGSLTTFSTFSWETAELLRTGQTTTAALSVLANLALGLAAVGLGVYAVHSLASA